MPGRDPVCLVFPTNLGRERLDCRPPARKLLPLGKHTLKALPCKLLGAGLVTAFLVFLFAPAAAAQVSGKKEKELSFQANAMPWKELFGWLADRTGMPVVTQGKTPTGAFDLISPQGTKYTVTE